MRTHTEKNLLESIRLVDGKCPLLAYHQDRVDRSRKLLFPKASALKLAKVMAGADLPVEGEHKIRIQYGQSVDSIDVSPYVQRDISSLKLLTANELRYEKKYADRSGLEACFQQRGDCDDVLLIQHGFVTDTSYANVALFDGRGWFTPCVPLLRGTRRAKLIREGTIRTAIIREKDLPLFKKIKLINSMMPWATAPVVPITAVHRSQPALSIVRP